MLGDISDVDMANSRISNHGWKAPLWWNRATGELANPRPAHCYVSPNLL